VRATSLRHPGISRLTILTPAYPPAVGGVEKHVSRLVDEFVRIGIQVEVVTNKGEPNPRSATSKQSGVRVHRVTGSSGRGGKISSLRSIIRMWTFLAKHLQLLQTADAVQTEEWTSFLWIFPFLLLTTRPRIIVFHGYEKYPVPKLVKIIRTVASLSMDARVDVGNYLSKWYGGTPDMVEFGAVDLPEGGSIEPPEDEVAYIGRLEEDTGIMQYVESLNILKSKHGLHFHLNICGNGSLKPAIDSYVRRHDLDVRLLGSLSNPRPILRKAKYAFVGGYLSLLEAMAERRPAFAIYNNPLKYDYFSMMPNISRMLFLAADADQLADVIAQCKRDERQMRQKVEVAYDFASNHSWERLASRYVELYCRKRSSLGK